MPDLSSCYQMTKMTGTGHGVGAYLNVHEGPMGIGSRAGETNGYPGVQLIPILNTYLPF